MTIDSKVLERVRALLAKAERTDNHHEAEVFSAKAAELMDRHRIDVAEVRGTEAPEFGRTQFDLVGNKYLRASLALLIAVCKHYGVLILLPTTGNSKHPTLVGDRDDVEAVKLMFGSLIIQRDRAMLASSPPPFESTTTYRNSFAYGYAHRIHARLGELRAAQRQAATTEGHTAALEVYDREARVRQWLEELEGRNLGKVNQNRARIDPYAAADGDAAARRADLGQSRLPGTGGPQALGAGR